MMPQGRYNNMNDKDWQDFGNCLFWWATSEYRMLLKASGSADQAVGNLALTAALESLARFLIVVRKESGEDIDFDEAQKEAYELVQKDFDLDLEQRMKL